MGNALRHWLRHPQGQLQLIAITFAVAVALAGAAASQRPFFERTVREKYPAPIQSTRTLAEQLEKDNAPPDRLLPSQWTLLYQLWIQADAPETQWPNLPGIIAARQPKLADEVVARTLVAGTAAQQGLAIRFAVASKSRELIPALRLGLDRARRAKATDVTQLEAALGALEAR